MGEKLGLLGASYPEVYTHSQMNYSVKILRYFRKFRFRGNGNVQLTTVFRLYFVARKVARARRRVNTTMRQAEITMFLAE